VKTTTNFHNFITVHIRKTAFIMPLFIRKLPKQTELHAALGVALVL